MADVITSSHNPRFKAALRLRDRQGRDEQQRFLIDGVRELRRAIAAGVEVVEVYAAPSLLTGDEARGTIAWLESLPRPWTELSADLFARLAYGDRHEGLIGVARTPSHRLADLALPVLPLVVVLEGVEKPGNLGAVLRSADAVAATAVVVADPRTDLFNPNAIRASLGTIFSLPVAAATGAETLAWLRAAGLQIVAARVDAELEYTQIDYRQPTAIVLGSEAHGLSDLWRAEGIVPIRLPMRGIGDSLNVSVTAAVILYEAIRR